MMAGDRWLVLYNSASEAALAAREAATSPGAAEACIAATQVTGGPVCTCPICKANRRCGRAIAEFDSYWRHLDDDDRELSLIRQRVLKDLPKVILENGTETREEVLRPPASKDEDGPAFQEKWNNADKFQRYLAENLPEIECRIEGDPPEASTAWADTDRRVRDFLVPLTDAPEVTKGSAGMSRRFYATEALHSLDEIQSLSQMMASAPAEDFEDADSEGQEVSRIEGLESEQRWLLECFAEIASRAFYAGVMTRAAAGKAIEQDAKRGAKTLYGSKMGAAITRGKKTTTTEEVLKFMVEKIDQGFSKTAAARMAAKSGLGTSAEANRKLWGRHHSK